MFGAGMWDFFVGDLPEVFVATLAIVGLAFAMRGVHLLAVIGLPLLVVVVLAASVRLRGSTRAKK